MVSYIAENPAKELNRIFVFFLLIIKHEEQTNNHGNIQYSWIYARGCIVIWKHKDTTSSNWRGIVWLVVNQYSSFLSDHQEEILKKKIMKNDILLQFYLEGHQCLQVFVRQTLLKDNSHPSQKIISNNVNYDFQNR